MSRGDVICANNLQCYQSMAHILPVQEQWSTCTIGRERKWQRSKRCRRCRRSRRSRRSRQRLESSCSRKAISQSPGAVAAVDIRNCTFRRPTFPSRRVESIPRSRPKDTRSALSTTASRLSAGTSLGASMRRAGEAR